MTHISSSAFLVHYHEIGLKGRNRPAFVRLLKTNIARALAGVPGIRMETLHDRLIIRAPERTANTVRERLTRVPGIAVVTPAEELPRGIAILAEHAIILAKTRSCASFCVRAERTDKSFPMTSEDINRVVGKAVADALHIPVHLDGPACTLYVHVLPKHVYLAAERIQGIGGLPVGASGHAVSLLSGGIDSPVASFLMMARGCRVTFLHFHSFPFLNRASIEKAEELAHLLGMYQTGAVLYLLPLGGAQREIVARAPSRLRVLLYRRLMLRVANALAAREGAGAVVTGENLGQVASQTLENITAVGKASDLPIFRPLIGLDKPEIIRRAKALGTYEISIRPDQDCCALFVPKHPATKVSHEELERAERALDVPRAVRAVIDHAERLEIS